MTYIEFFDRNASENICASLSNMPQRVILVGDRRKQMLKNIEFYREVFSGRGLSTEFICMTVTKNNLESIVSALCQIVESYDDCVFDATGGDDLYLVALGVVWQKYQGKNVKIQRFNLRSGTIQDCDADGVTTGREMPALTVEENIRIYGGKVFYEEQIPLGTHVWSMGPEFEGDILRIWEICRRDPRAWNQQVSILEAAEGCKLPDSALLTTEVSTHQLLQVTKKPDVSSLLHTDILLPLLQAELLEEFAESGGRLRITYKDRQVKRLLTKAGLALEMSVFQTLRTVPDQKGQPVYNDVMTGVTIDWDGELFDPPRGNGPQNEVDVIAMRGMLPVFISCKNGLVDADELYKLYTVAENFGGQYVKKVLIATSLDPNSAYAQQLLQRAQELEIRVVTDWDSMSPAQREKTARSFWSN